MVVGFHPELAGDDEGGEQGGAEAKTRRTLMCSARMPERSRPRICALKMADIMVEPTRPMSSAGVSSWMRVCEGTMMPAADEADE